MKAAVNEIKQQRQRLMAFGLSWLAWPRCLRILYVRRLVDWLTAFRTSMYKSRFVEPQG